MYRSAKHIGLYYAANGEVDLNHFWLTACSHGKYCYYPVINTKNILEFYAANPNTEFSLNKFNIREPVRTADSEPLSVGKLDLIILPLISFDSMGNRLGMGAGFYDRTLERLKAQDKRTTFLGVAYEFQRRDSLARYQWDIPIDCVITEHSFYKE